MSKQISEINISSRLSLLGKCLLLWIILPQLLTVYALNLSSAVNSGEIIFSKNLVPSAQLSLMLEAEKIKSNNYTDIVKQTQAKWLRHAEQERWDIKNEESFHYSDLFKQLGMVDAIYPSNKEYFYLVIFGATAPTMITRMEFLKKLIEKKSVIFQKIIILTGPRELNFTADISNINNPFYLNAITKFSTETEVATFLANELFIKTKLIHPENINIIDAQEYSGTRPNTTDTIKAWLKQDPRPASILAISNQPYIGRQSAVLQYRLPKTFEIETVGPMASRELADNSFLDCLARWIYQLVELKT